MGMSSNNIWTEMIDNEDLIKGQYNLVAGNWPQKFNEVLLVVDEENEISDMALYALGLTKFNRLLKITKRLTTINILNNRIHMKIF